MKEEERVCVRRARNGNGLFTRRDATSRETILEIKGELILVSELGKKDQKTIDNSIRYSKEYYISPSGEMADYLNHSCRPNAYIKNEGEKIFLIADGEIKRGSEVLIDYSTIIAEDDDWTMKCNCGESKCRKIVGKFIDLSE